MLDRLRGLLTDRFTVFALVGLAFFGIDMLNSRQTDRIHINQADLAMLEGRYELQAGRSPSADELEALIAFHAREEILVREARRLGLDQGDVILRRRLAQKMELLLQDGLPEPVITDVALDRYYEATRDRYVRPARIGFRHIYLGSGDPPAPVEVDRLQNALEESPTSEAWRGMGEAFMLAREYAPRPQPALAELFGPGFAAALFDARSETGWWGPIQSAYGWHLVRALTYEPEAPLSRAELGTTLIEDFTASERAVAEAEAYDRLARRYEVTVDRAPP